MSTWSAPVRYGEVDAQGIVFNSHYLLYCDEAVTAFFAARGMATASDDIRLVNSNLTWSASARWGDVVDVDAECTRVGRTSFAMTFGVRVGDTSVCRVETTYVHTDRDGTPTPIPAEVRSALGHIG